MPIIMNEWALWDLLKRKSQHSAERLQIGKRNFLAAKHYRLMILHEKK